MPVLILNRQKWVSEKALEAALESRLAVKASGYNDGSGQGRVMKYKVRQELPVQMVRQGSTVMVRNELPVTTEQGQSIPKEDVSMQDAEAQLNKKTIPVKERSWLDG